MKPTPHKLKRSALFVLLVILGVLIDLLSKQTAFSHLKLYQGTDWIFQWEGILAFRFHAVMNEGTLWGLGQGYAWLFAIMSFFAMAGILFWLYFLKGLESLWLTLSLSSILSGTIGNLYDRMALHGMLHPVSQKPWAAVRDFLSFKIGTYDWPVFNFADVFLVVGACSLMITFFVEDKHRSQNAFPSAAE